MPNTQKTAANKSKSSSAGARPKATSSTKENTKPRTSKATGTRPALALKPLQTQALSSSAKDAETAALLASLRAEIDQLKKRQATNPTKKKSGEIPRPTKMTKLQDAMGLTEDKKLYTHCRSVVRDVAAHAGLPLNVDWRSQDAVMVGKIVQVANSRSKQLQQYQGNWATLEILKTLLKNRRSYRSRIGSLDEQDKQDVKKEPDGEEDEGGNGGDDSDNSDNNGNNGDNNGNGGDDSDENGNNNDNIGNGGDDSDDNRNNDENNDDDSSWEDMYMRNKKVDDDEDNEDEGESEDKDGKDNERGGKAGMKRKVDDEPAAATRAKRKKMNDSGGHQAATNSTKRTLPKRKAGKKKD